MRPQDKPNLRWLQTWPGIAMSPQGIVVSGFFSGLMSLRLRWMLTAHRTGLVV
jgi:hypothetical protein